MSSYKFRIYGYNKMLSGDDVIIDAHLPLNDIVQDSKRYKFMLNTNCKDKKGKEIYESDIVLFMGGEKFEVKYVEDGFVLVNLETREPLGYLHNFLQYIEVIGNIWEGIVINWKNIQKRN